MRVLILAGASRRNELWADELCRSLASHDVLVHRYAHWTADVAADIDIDHEVAAVTTLLVQFRADAVIAKSAGAIVLLRVCAQQKVAVPRAAILGLPVRWANERSIDVGGLLRSCDCALLFVQNREDPLGFAKDVAALIAADGATDRLLFEINAATHEYPIAGPSLALLREFLDEGR